MRKIALSALIIAVFLFASCATKVSDDSFSKIYDKHSGLIVAGATKYTVKSGDTLANIARNAYGGVETPAFYYPVIMLASKNTILDPDKIQPGMELTIPNLQVNLANPEGRSAVKGVILDLSNVERSRKRTETADGMRKLANSL
ncbi:MAG: LysM peptidoglycan-binding domain-containing protein [Treponema sp.]|nr:LysM peptidoglycan-binding domain-containing protein [Treponema sp.]MCL2250687.1 LysM peptidoglycan-binding domain-containing protein [Treponema sp.]